MAQRITGPGTNAVPGGSGSTTPPEYEAPITVFADSISRVFQYLDKSPARIPSGILEECGMQFIDHAPFTGLTYTIDNQLDMNRWRALYGDMDGARINDNASVVPLATANLFLKPFANDSYVELPILHFDYHSIRTDALSSNRMQSVRNRLYDVAGQNPYQLNTVFAVAATDAALPTSSPSFVFRPSLFWTNTGRTVATLQADFADGSGFVPLTWNTPRAVSYSTGGAKDVRVRVTYTDGSAWVSHCQVIAPESVAARYAGVSSVTPFTLTADIPYQGAYASALISIEYGGRNKATPDPAVLDKPLIVVKGFDVSGIFNDENIVPRSTYEGFIIGQLGRQGCF
jgi:hypothetical protein